MTNIQIVEKSDQVILANNFVALAVDKARGQYTLVSVCDKIPARLEARTDIMYQTAAGGSRQAWPGQVTHWQHAPHQDVHGTGIEARFDLAPLTRHLSTQLQVRLYADQPFIALRLVAHNQCTQPVSLKSFSPLHAVPRDKGLVRIGLEARPLTWLKNGYQAWSFAGALQAHQLDIGTRLGPITRLQVFNGLTPQSRRRGVFWSEMFALLGNVPCGVGILAGQLTTADQFTAIGADCRADQSALQTICQADDVTLSPDAQMASEWIYLEFADLRSDDPLAAYTAAVGRQMKARIPSSVKSGWCSWYYFFTQVQEQDFLANLDTIARAHAELPFQVVQLDDGYQSDVGDWLSINVKFPHGLAWLAEQVKAHGLAPGLWIAPFIVKPTAQLESDHPEWLLKDRRGRPVSSGYNWWQWTHALDVSQPGAQEYVRQVIDTAVHEWGFPYLKLDFLYAAAMPGQRLDPSLTRAQALRQGLELIRQAAGDETYLLGCGCPLGPGIGLFDANRIGPDVAPNWRPRLFGTQLVFGKEATLPSARNAIRNTLVRSSMHGRWWHNDPDCLLVRHTLWPANKDELGLTENELYALASVIGLSGGLVLSSDNLSVLPPEQRHILAALLPAFGQSAAPLDLLEGDIPELFVLRMGRSWGHWTVAGLFNWGETPARRVLSLERLGLKAPLAHHVFDFWNRRYYRTNTGQLAFDAVPPHAGHVLSVCPIRDEPHVIATTLHITMGGEISDLKFNAKRSDCACHMTIDLGRTAQGQVWMGLPLAQRARATCNGRPTPVTHKLPGIWAIEADVDRQAEITLQWS